ncbi:hypothetical protein [Sphingomonas colocasiae]|uniref:DUF2889 domain-containing protein n=1 Tax=Sphingomonas colocasiae TaxID=1848973 RepID=A0ABS7PKV9_9SPHN|nr:hypothetical protein [Sphingomonas colocasiae]MBY8821881.1 hypothetical protein [Sphingomonas colocasiae]
MPGNPAISAPMPIALFENRNSDPLILRIDPAEQDYEIPPLATLGVRYTLREGTEERSHASMSGNRIFFWCDSDHEVDLVLPCPADRLLHDLCVVEGCCGHYFDDEDVYRHVTHLLPKTGTVTAEEFAMLALQAEGDTPDRKGYAAGFERIKALFLHHMGAPAVPAEQLEGNYAQPFESRDHG